MKVSQHAVRRYKKRIGNRTASKKRIVGLIQREIEKNTINKWYYKDTDSLYIETSKFIAVCSKNTVVTILSSDTARISQGAKKEVG